jgi:hypothetical protein
MAPKVWTRAFLVCDLFLYKVETLLETRTHKFSRGKGEGSIRFSTVSCNPRSFAKYDIGVMVAEKRTEEFAFSNVSLSRSEGSLQYNFTLRFRRDLSKIVP